MRPRIIIVAAAAALCACHQTRQPKPAQVAEVRKHARAAERHEGAPGPQAAPESVPTVKVLQKDPAAGCTWIQTKGLVTVGDQETRHQARASAIEEARKSAMQDFLGVDVQSRFLDFEQETLRDQERLTENILRTTRLGRILKEEVVSEGYKDAGDCAACRYEVQLKTCLTEIPKDADHDFRVELGLSRTNFVEGDEARLTVTATKDCYVYLYDVDMDWATSMLVPNQAVAEVKLKAGQAWEYPDDELRRGGIRLVAQVPDGQNVSAETIRVVATKTPLTLRKEDPAMGGYLSLLRRLNSSRVDWAEDTQAFVIHRK